MSSAASHQTIVRAKPEFLRRLMAERAGNAHISPEGDLSHCRFIDDLVLTRDETPILKRNTLAPTHDFIVLCLANETIEPIFRQIQAARLKRAILHVEIRLSETLCCNWAPYDNFRDGCVVTRPRIGQHDWMSY